MENQTEMDEIGTVRRKSNFDSNPLSWALGEETGMWDMCIVFDNINQPSGQKDLEAWQALKEKRGSLLYELSSIGIMYSMEKSADKKSMYCLLSATRARYELQAEIMGMEFELQPRYGGGFLPFLRKNKSVYLRAFNDDFFTPTQRQAILKDMLNQSSFKGGAGISIKQVLKDGVAKKWFPFHSEATLRYFRQTWATWRVYKWWHNQPIDQIQTYFGEELTLYFAWLGFYNTFLIVPAVLGVLVMAIVYFATISAAPYGAPLSDDFGREDSASFVGWFMAGYSLVLMLWSTAFLEQWKRYNARLSFRWNMVNFEASERSRPEYRGEMKLGVHAHGEWIEFHPDDEALDQVHVVPTLYYDERRTKVKIGASFMPLVMMLAVVIIAVMSILYLRLILQRDITGGAGGVIGSVIGAIVIIIFNVLYGMLAVKLNEWENHRTETQHQDALIFKTFLFQFVNTFTALYYIAFAKRATDFGQLIGRDSLQDQCKSAFMDERGRYLQYFNKEDFVDAANAIFDGFTETSAQEHTFLAMRDGIAYRFQETFAGTFGFRPDGGYVVDNTDGFTLYSYKNSTDVDAMQSLYEAFPGHNGNFSFQELIGSFENNLSGLNEAQADAYISEVTKMDEFYAGALKTRILGAGCVSELVIQLATLMIINIVIGQAREVLLPLVKVWVVKLLTLFNLRNAEDETDKEAALARPWEKQAKLVPFEGTFAEYAEIAIQYCLVVTFAAAFPLAPLLALINNVIEVRTDAIKIVTTNNKPYYKGAEDIGGWYSVLEVIGYIAVVTNSLLILLSFSVLPVLVLSGEPVPDNGPGANDALLCVIIAVALEHLMFLAKVVLAALVPDMPGEVRREMARREFLRNELQSELEKRPHFREPNLEDTATASKAFGYSTSATFIHDTENFGNMTDQGIITGAPCDWLVLDEAASRYDELIESSKSATKKRRKKKSSRRDSDDDSF